MILVLLAVVITGLFLLTVNTSFIGKRSIHDDARAYRTRHCLAFYPDSKTGQRYARSLCKGVKDDSIHDYSIVPYGDYYLISYGNEHRYFTDRNYEAVTLNELDEDGRKILVDYLRYEIKKNDPERYYDPSFLKTLDAEHVDFSRISYDLSLDSIHVEYEEYGYEADIPLKYLQKALNMDFGFPYEIYRKPVYISDIEDHPVICLTFNDGPDVENPYTGSASRKIVDLLYRYDACATFYVTGKDLRNWETWADYQVYYLLLNSVNNGNSYGSFTQDRVDLTTIDPEDIRDEISGPVVYLRDLLGYRMSTSRPVAGDLDDNVLEQQPLPAILWNIDSCDWLYEDPEEIYQEIMENEPDNGDIIVLHDEYEETCEALEKLIPELVSRGYQLLTVEDMLLACGIDISALEYCYDSGNYE